MSKNVDQKGRRAEPRHVRLYHSVTGCLAWQHLTGNGVKLLVALARLDKGGHNGELFMSVRKASEECGFHRNTTPRVFRELQDKGFIAATRQGGFGVNGGLATCWRLTWLAAPGYPPTRDFERWTPPVGNKTPSQKMGVPVTNFVHRPGNGPPTCTENVTATDEKPLVSVGDPCTDNVTQVVSQGRRASSPDNTGGKQANSTAGIFDDAQTALRDRLTNYLDRAGVGAQTRLATVSRIPGGTLSKFKAEGKPLNRTHFVALQLELGRVDRVAA